MPVITKNKKSGELNKNIFPVNVLPVIFKDLVRGLNETLNYPIDYTGTAILTALATAIGTKVKAKVKDNWYEYGSLYTCILGNAGANKSHPLATIFDPIKKIDKQSHDEYTLKYKVYVDYQKLTSRERDLATPIREPVLKKMVLTNFTPEVLNKRLNDNHRGCTVLSDELASFFEGMNNYSKGDSSSTYLSFWSNQSTTIDRVGKHVPLFIEKPYLSIIGGLQPRLLSKVFKPKMMDSGLLQRFLFAYPQRVYKKPINDKVLDHKILKKYSDFISSYINITNSEGNQTRTLTWTDEAKNYFYNWHSKNCELVNAYSGNIKGEVISKFDIHFIRLSLILQIMEDPNSTEIVIKAVKGANALCKYYLNCSLKILKKIHNTVDHLNQLPEDKKRFYKTLKNKFITAEAIKLGAKFDLKERRLKDFLKDQYYFMKIKHGHYEKKYNTKINY
jgi:hypothetical protein